MLKILNESQRIKFFFLFCFFNKVFPVLVMIEKMCNTISLTHGLHERAFCYRFTHSTAAFSQFFLPFTLYLSSNFQLFVKNLNDLIMQTGLICNKVTSESSDLSLKAVAMLFCMALIHACFSFSESACIIQLLYTQTRTCLQWKHASHLYIRAGWYISYGRDHIML